MNRKENEKQEEELPSIMIDANQAQQLVQSIQKDNMVGNNQADLSRYLVMEGMQNEEKIPFFTELLSFDDTLRMNTIEAYVNIAPLIIRKTSEKNMVKINNLLQSVYLGHVRGHKRNMVSLKRQRESAYVRILSTDTTDNIGSTGLQKFFGVGGGKIKK